MMLKEEKRVKLIPWLKEHRPCAIRFSYFGQVLNIMTETGYIIRIPIIVLLNDKNDIKWQEFVFEKNKFEEMKEEKNKA